MPVSALVLEKKNILYWLRQMRKKAELIAPVRAGEDIVFKTVDRLHEIALDCPASMPSLKEFLFPQFEPMLEFHEGSVKGLAVDTKRVVFGVRSCDVAAITLMDKFFLGDIKDPYYEARRNNTLFISIVCNRPDNTCFCSGLGTGPFLKGGFDIQLFDLGDRYLVEADSIEGRRWVNRYKFLMRKTVKTDLEDQYEVQLSSKAIFNKQINLERARLSIKAGDVNDDFWENVADKCFECGGCVYECPLCTCHTVIDRAYEGRIERSRLWDTCLYKGFTSLAGQRPDNPKSSRLKRWYYHKLLYYPETLGAFGCVGCGRCAVTCPGSIDMATVVSMMKNGQKE